jgi:hypothetical protein
MIIMETSVCAVTYFHCGPPFITNRFRPLFPKFVPKRSVHNIVHCIEFTLSKLKDITKSAVMNAVMAIECGNLITVPYQGSLSHCSYETE